MKRLIRDFAGLSDSQMLRTFVDANESYGEHDPAPKFCRSRFNVLLVCDCAGFSDSQMLRTFVVANESYGGHDRAPNSVDLALMYYALPYYHTYILTYYMRFDGCLPYLPCFHTYLT